MPTRNYTQETWGDNMKDRTPKFPGRVKLKPVAGQTDTYDMTRADDPDDTGTPFNTRTMLQDSTGRFLRLPYANPFVDDAFRHIPDRIEPIGTVKTSPALSLGDAWLPCDGSTVTFEHYPQLCSVLRNTSGAVEWASNTFLTSYDVSNVSNAVYFNGLWFICTQVGNNYKILKSTTLEGTFSEDATFTGSATTFEGMTCSLAASDHYCVCVFCTGKDIKIAVREKENANWTQVNVSLPPERNGSGFYGIAQCNGRFGFSFARYETDENDTDHTYAVFSDTPLIPESWVCSLITKTPSTVWNQFIGYKFSSANGKWFLSAIRKNIYSGATGKIELYFANGAETSFKKLEPPVPEDAVKRISASEVVFLSGTYYFLVTVYSRIEAKVFYDPKSTVYYSQNLTNWEASVITGESKPATACMCHAAATDTMLLVATQTDVWTTSSPNDGFNKTSVQANTISGVSLHGMTATASYNGGVAYHDYTYDARSLPTISLSDDTTTFIKAKNELDVFEAGGD